MMRCVLYVLLMHVSLAVAWTRNRTTDYLLGSTPQGKDQPLDVLLGNILKWDFALDLVILRRGFSHVGSGIGLRRAVQKMMSGQQTLLTAVGGSFTHGHDAKIGETDYVTVLRRYLEGAFNATRLHNGAVGGSGSAYMSQCLRASASADTDLLLMEYMLNDPLDGKTNVIMDNVNVKSYERLIRHARSLRPEDPTALMMVNAGSYGMWNEAGTPNHRLPVKAVRYHWIMEDVDSSLSLYYDIPVISMRSAAGCGPFADKFWEETVPLRSHPNDLGHRYTADLIIFALQQTAIDLLLTPVLSLPTPSPAPLTMPPPMYQDNEISSSITCAPFEALKHIVQNTSGFEFRTERGKAGYIGFNVGDTVSFGVSTALKTHELDIVPTTSISTSWEDLFMKKNSTQSVYIGLAYLSSYEHMGKATVVCTGGCNCTSATIDALHFAHTSVTSSMRLGPVTRSENCTIKVSIIPSTPPRLENKFKVLAIIVSLTGLMTGGIAHYDSISLSNYTSSPTTPPA